MKRLFMEQDRLDQASQNLGNMHGNYLGNHLREVHLVLEGECLHIEVICELMELLHNLRGKRGGRQGVGRVRMKAGVCEVM